MDADNIKRTRDQRRLYRLAHPQKMKDIGINHQRRLYETNNSVADSLIKEYNEISQATLKLMNRWALLMDEVAETVKKKDIKK